MRVTAAAATRLPTIGSPTMHFGFTTAALLFIMGHIAFVAIAAVLFVAG
jgi:hypothetical protein